MHGTVRIEPSGDGHCRRTDQFTVEAKIFGLGGLIESSIEDDRPAVPRSTRFWRDGSTSGV